MRRRNPVVLQQRVSVVFQTRSGKLMFYLYPVYRIFLCPGGEIPEPICDGDERKDKGDKVNCWCRRTNHTLCTCVDTGNDGWLSFWQVMEVEEGQLPFTLAGKWCLTTQRKQTYPHMKMCKTSIDSRWKKKSELHLLKKMTNLIFCQNFLWVRTSFSPNKEALRPHLPGEPD